MKTLLILGASILQLPAILKAKELGYRVAVADYNPKAVGIEYADDYYDVSTIDEAGVASLAKQIGAAGVMTLATDMPMRSIAAACEACALPGISHDTAIMATDKGEMIKAFERCGVAHPWYHVVGNRNELRAIAPMLTFPCIMKPTDNAGSRGVVLIHTPEELKSAYRYARGSSRRGAVIIEEYLTGPEFSVEVVVTHGKPHVLQITDKLTTGAPHFVETGHTQPTAQPADVADRIRDLASRAVKAVGILDGPAHVEMILTPKGPKMVELGARMGGDCITTHLVPLSTGIDMIKATIDIACGIEPDIEPKFSRAAAIRYFMTDKGTIRSIEGVEEAKAIPGVREIAFAHGVGETVGEIESSVDRVGFVIADGETTADAIAACEKAIDTVKINVG